MSRSHISMLVMLVMGAGNVHVHADEVVQGEGSLFKPAQLEGIDIVDKTGSRVPLDIKLTNDLGQLIRLQDYFQENGKPVVLTLGYYKCPMLCSLVLNGFLETMQNTTQVGLGLDYQVVSVSINPDETFDLAAAKRRNYIAGIADAQANAWRFHVASEVESKRLADAVGFNFKKDARSGEYAHGAAVFVISPKGVLTRTLWGITYTPNDFKMALVEAGEGRVGTIVDRVILSCFHYVPDSRRYGVYIMGVMRLAGLLTIVVVGLYLAMYWRRERRMRTWTT